MDRGFALSVFHGFCGYVSCLSQAEPQNNLYLGNMQKLPLCIVNHIFWLALRSSFLSLKGLREPFLGRNC